MTEILRLPAEKTYAAELAALKAGDTGLICSFGAGYSAGTVFVRKVA